MKFIIIPMDNYLFRRSPDGWEKAITSKVRKDTQTRVTCIVWWLLSSRPSCTQSKDQFFRNALDDYNHMRDGLIHGEQLRKALVAIGFSKNVAADQARKSDHLYDLREDRNTRQTQGRKLKKPEQIERQKRLSRIRSAKRRARLKELAELDNPTASV